jgi:hypothetical protein
MLYSTGATMRVFKTRWFARFARRESISDRTLVNAVAGAECGLIDAVLGGDLIKLRIARPRAGKRGGYRAIIAYGRARRAVFLIGFAKSARDNINPDQLADLKEAASELLALSDDEIDQRLRTRTLEEIDHDEDP